MTRSEAASVVRSAETARPGSPPGPPRRVGDWELLSLGATGRLGEVYRARPAGAGNEHRACYAVKVLRPEWENEPRAVQTMVREAHVGSRISHPHLVPILAAGLAQPPYFVVMPWLDGATLANQLARPIEPPLALWIVRQAAEALAALHAGGWMHGDVKPSNLFVSPEGHVTLLDLGFARRDGETGSVVDRCVLGACAYVAPEAISSALRADIRSDLYSLGVVLYEMLAGQVPFLASELEELVRLHFEATPPDLRRLVPSIPREIAQLVEQLLSKEPLRRPQTPRELVGRLIGLEVETFCARSLLADCA